MGGLTEAYAMANMQFITFDADGNCVGSNYMDYLLPTAWETPGFELHEVVTPCPHHPIGAKGVGECATVGGPAAFVNAVMDAHQGHRRPQHRHAAAPRPGLRGAHRAPRRLRRAAGPVGRLTRKAGCTGMDGWEVLERAAELARARRGVRARHRGLAAGPVVGAAGRARDHHRRRRAARLDRRRLRRAGRDPRGAAGDRRRRAAAAAPRAPRSSSARRCPEGMTVIPISCQSEGALEVYIEPVLPAPHLVVVGRSPMAHTLADLAEALGWRAELRRRRRLLRGRRGRARRWSWSPPRATATRTRSSRRSRPARLPRPGRLAASAARPCSATSPTGACPQRPARPGAGAGRARPRPHHAPGDRGRDPGRAGPAAGVAGELGAADARRAARSRGCRPRPPSTAGRSTRSAG